MDLSQLLNRSKRLRHRRGQLGPCDRRERQRHRLRMERQHRLDRIRRLERLSVRHGHLSSKRADRRGQSYRLGARVRWHHAGRLLFDGEPYRRLGWMDQLERDELRLYRQYMRLVGVCMGKRCRRMDQLRLCIDVLRLPSRTPTAARIKSTASIRRLSILIPTRAAMSPLRQLLARSMHSA